MLHINVLYISYMFKILVNDLDWVGTLLLTDLHNESITVCIISMDITYGNNDVPIILPCNRY